MVARMTTNDDNAPRGEPSGNETVHPERADWNTLVVPDFRPCQALDVVSVEVGDQLVLTHPSAGRVISIDAVSAALWHYFDGDTPLQILVDDVVDCLGLDPAAAEANVHELARSFGAAGYLAEPGRDTVRRSRPYPPIAPDT